MAAAVEYAMPITTSGPTYSLEAAVLLLFLCIVQSFSQLYARIS